MKCIFNNLLVTFLLVLLFTAPSYGEDEKKSADKKPEDILARIISDTKETSKAEALGDPAKPLSLPTSINDPETLALYAQSWRDYYRYRSSGLAHRSQVFKWQLLSGKLIFVIVLGLVISGVVFAAIQFRHGLKTDQTEDVATQVELGTKGIKLSSPILGVIILFLSLGFFYLYLVHIFPVENVF